MGKVPVFIGLDCEDAFNPEADDALLRLCEIHSDAGVPLNLFVAGQKARVLRRNGRYDVIAAMQDHNIGYHGNYWFDYPELALRYGVENDWDSAVEKALSYELPGLNDVAEITGHYPISYVLHQANHSPATGYALRQGGMRINNGGFGDHLPGNGWVMDTLFAGRSVHSISYQGRWHQVSDPLHPERQKPAVDAGDEFADFQRAFDAQLEKGLSHICILGHPTCWVFSEWWGWYDFSLPFRANEPGGPGRYPHDRQWRKSMRRSEADTAAHYEWTRMAAEWLARRDDVEVMKMEDYYAQVSEPQGQWLDIEQVREMARKLTQRFDAVEIGGTSVSTADALYLLATLGEHIMLYGRVPEKLQIRRTMGPVEKVPEVGHELTFGRDGYMVAARSVYAYVEGHGHIPHKIKAHGVESGPAEVLMALAQAFAGNELPEAVHVAGMAGVPECAALPIFENGRAGSTNAPAFHDNSRMNMLCRMQSWSYRPLAQQS